MIIFKQCKMLKVRPNPLLSSILSPQNSWFINHEEPGLTSTRKPVSSHVELNQPLRLAKRNAKQITVYWVFHEIQN